MFRAAGEHKTNMAAARRGGDSSLPWPAPRRSVPRRLVPPRLVNAPRTRTLYVDASTRAENQASQGAASLDFAPDVLSISEIRAGFIGFDDHFAMVSPKPG